MTQPEIVIDLVKAEMRSINHFSLGGKSLKQERDYNTLAAWLLEAEAKEIYVVVAEGEGAGVTVVSGALEQPLHDFMCSCGHRWQECPSEGTHEDLDRTQDTEEWSRDEEGKPFSINWKFETGSLAVYRKY